MKNLKKIKIEIPDRKKYDFIKKSVYGGRCNAIKKEYTSNSKFENYEDLIKSKDFIFNADVSSLYPTAMADFKHLYVRYPIGISRWSETPKIEFNKKNVDSMKLNMHHQQILIIRYYQLD